ncbi:unnamed protein product [Effrenium voratum]|nr:unnamed protein product [Effrenium voratum]
MADSSSNDSETSTESSEENWLWPCSRRRRCEPGSFEELDPELQNMIFQRDTLNASIEEHVRRQGLDQPVVNDVTSKSSIAFVDPLVERQWRSIGCLDQVVLGSYFLALCEIMLRLDAIIKVLNHGCSFEGMGVLPMFRLTLAYNVLCLLVLVPLPLLNTYWKSIRLHMVLMMMAYTDRLVANFPLLHVACSQRHQELECQLMDDMNCSKVEYYRFQMQMFSVMAQVLVLPEYRYCAYMWCWIFLAALVASAIVANEEDWALDAKNEFFVRLVLLSLVQMVASRKKCTMEEQTRSLFLTNLKNREVSMSMFRILEFMVPDFVILPMLQHAQNPSVPLSFHCDSASVLFIAFDDFEEVVQRKTPPELLQFLNKYYNLFDFYCAAYGVTKIETVAEEYVCAVGVRPKASDCFEDVLTQLIKVAAEIRCLQVRDRVVFKMGLHTGPVVAGVMGTKLPRFRLFGDTVNTAARMMQKSLPGEVQMGESTRKQLPDWVQVRFRGDIEMKGKGLMAAYLLDGIGNTRLQAVEMLATGTGRERLKTPKALYSALVAGKQATEGPGCGGPGAPSAFNDVIGQIYETKPRRRTCRQALHFFGPGWRSFPEDLEGEFQQWYQHAVFAGNFSAPRLQRQAGFLLLLTLAEAAYMLFMSSDFQTANEFLGGVEELWLYFTLRFSAITVCLLMSCVCPRWIYNPRKPHVVKKSAKVGTNCLHLIFVCLVMLSYMLLPSYANQGSAAVPDNVVALLFLPVYAAFMISYQLEFLASLWFITGFTVILLALGHMPNTAQNGYPSEGIAFLGYSLIFVVKAFMGEMSLRDQFKARKAINTTKVHIEGILESMMPHLVVYELQRLPPDAPAPSHHYFRATVVQSDLVGFTRMASLLPPEEVVKAVSEIFSIFDKLAENHGVYKVETVGDAYIAGQAEPPLTSENDPPSVIRFGLGMVHAASDWSETHGQPIKVRVGVHTGECIGGIVGIDKQRYHLFGQLMHQLELLESTAPECFVQISQSCKQASEALADFHFVERPEPYLVTSKGEVHQYPEVGGRTFLVSAQTGTRIESAHSLRI